jgi:hypothetical protein
MAPTWRNAAFEGLWCCDLRCVGMYGLPFVGRLAQKQPKRIGCHHRRAVFPASRQENQLRAETRNGVGMLMFCRLPWATSPGHQRLPFT